MIICDRLLAHVAYKMRLPWPLLIKYYLAEGLWFHLSLHIKAVRGWLSLKSFCRNNFVIWVGGPSVLSGRISIYTTNVIWLYAFLTTFKCALSDRIAVHHHIVLELVYNCIYCRHLWICKLALSMFQQMWKRFCQFLPYSRVFCPTFWGKLRIWGYYLVFYSPDLSVNWNEMGHTHTYFQVIARSVTFTSIHFADTFIPSYFTYKWGTLSFLLYFRNQNENAKFYSLWNVSNVICVWIWPLSLVSDVPFENVIVFRSKFVFNWFSYCKIFLCKLCCTWSLPFTVNSVGCVCVCFSVQNLLLVQFCNYACFFPPFILVQI